MATIVGKPLSLASLLLSVLLENTGIICGPLMHHRRVRIFEFMLRVLDRMVVYLALRSVCAIVMLGREKAAWQLLAKMWALSGKSWFDFLFHHLA